MAISDNVSMFFGAKPDIFEKAAILREHMTEAEKLLWEKLKDRSLFHYKFRRQHPIDIFIVDFYCHPIHLVIEVDGGYHLNAEQKEYDIGRSAELEYWELKIIRFANNDIFTNIDEVVKKIQKEVKVREIEIKKSSEEQFAPSALPQPVK
jgi:very-short-patch-repair endonuclease